MSSVELRPDDEGVARFYPANGKRTAENIAARYNRVLDAWVTAGSLIEAFRNAGYMRPDKAVRRFKDNHPEVFDEVRRRRAALAKKIELSQESVVLELARLAFSNIGRVVGWEDGRLTVVDSEVIDDDTMASIQEVGVDGNGNLKIKLYDKRGALVDLGKFMGLGAGTEGANLTALLARLAGASDGEVLEAQRMDGREAARRVALLLRKGRELTKAP